MKLILVIVASLVVIAAADPTKEKSSEGNNESSLDMYGLTPAQRACIMEKMWADTSIRAALLACRANYEGLTCIKAIPGLVTCF